MDQKTQPSPEDVKNMVTHLRRLESATAVGDIVTAVHWLNKILKRNNSSFAKLADHPQHLLVDPSLLPAYVAANQRYAAQNDAILAENKKMREKIELRAKIKRAFSGAINPESKFAKALGWLSLGLFGPASVAVGHALNFEDFREESTSDKVGTYIVSSCIMAFTHLVVNVADAVVAKNEAKDMKAIAYQKSANLCAEGNKNEPQMCSAKYDAVNGPVSGIFPFSWLSEHHPAGEIVVSRDITRKPVINQERVQVGLQVCHKSGAYNVPKLPYTPNLGAGYKLPDPYGEAANGSCNFIPFNEAAVSKDVSLREVIEIDETIRPVVDEQGMYLGQEHCKTSSSYVVRGQAHYSGKSMQPGWKTSLPMANALNCEFKQLKME